MRRQEHIQLTLQYTENFWHWIFISNLSKKHWKVLGKSSCILIYYASLHVKLLRKFDTGTIFYENYLWLSECVIFVTDSLKNRMETEE